MIHIDERNPRPVYQQICDAIKYDIARGALREGDRLPTVRDLAGQLRVNRNTVARAYGDLERDGVIYTRPGAGCFVAATSSDRLLSERLRVIEAKARELVVEAYHLEIPAERLRGVLDRIIENIEKGRKES